MGGLTMRHYYFAAFFALIIVGCSKADNEKNYETTDDGVTFINLGVEQSVTKTSLTGTVDILWSAGDQIAVDTYSDGMKTFTLVDGEGTASGTFSYPGTVTVTGGEYGRTTFYPASMDPVYNGGDEKWHITLPDEYTWSEQGIKAPMYTWIGKSYDYLKMMGGVLKVDAYNIPSDADKLVFTTSNQKVSGEFAFDGTDIDTSDDDVNKTITISFTAGALSSRTFFIPVPVGNYTAGATIQLKDSGNNVLKNKTAPALSVARGEIKYLPAIDCNAARASSNIFSGSHNTDYYVSEKVEFDFSGVQEGDIIRFTFTENSAVVDAANSGANAKDPVDSWAIQFSDPSWAALFNIGLISGHTTHDFYVTSSMATALSSLEYVYLSGYAVTVTSIDLIPAKPETVLWVGSVCLGTGWSWDTTLSDSNGISNASFWSTLASGKILTIHYTPESAGDISLCKNSPWSTIITTRTNTYTTALPITLTSGYVTEIKAGGIAIQGTNVTVTKITLK